MAHHQRYFRVGVTGTQDGATEAQISSFAYLMIQILRLEYRDFEFHFGDCVGADMQMFGWVSENLLTGRTVAHPGLTEEKRAYCQAEEVREPMENLARNACIAASDVLIGLPRSRGEVWRSGTWHTLRLGHCIQRVYSTWPEIYVIDPYEGRIVSNWKPELDIRNVTGEELALMYGRQLHDADLFLA